MVRAIIGFHDINPFEMHYHEMGLLHVYQHHAGSKIFIVMKMELHLPPQVNSIDMMPTPECYEIAMVIMG
jgi:hypothetical protein